MTDANDQTGATPTNGQGQRLRKFFEAAVKYEASDMILKPNTPVKLRLRGTLKNLDTTPFKPEEFAEALKTILSPKHLAELQDRGSCDMAYEHDEDNRFRVNVFRTRGVTALAARRVSSDILDFKDLHLPDTFKKIAEHHQGLVLLAGITGSGKSTTIASMLQYINNTRPCHIVTIEDPIEFIFKDDKAIINQREVGVDARDFSDALRALVRENPDVVLIGEMRDRETFQAALQAAETGHLVFGTIHASSCSQTFGRIYDLFDADERGAIRSMLAENMQAIVYQKLLETLLPEVPRVPGIEVLLNTPIVTKYIHEGREVELETLIRQGEQEGMVDFNNWLVQLVQKEYIHPRVALTASRNPDELKMRLKGITTGTG